MAKVSTLKMDKRITFIELQEDEDNPFPSEGDAIEVDVYSCWARVFTLKQDIIKYLGQDVGITTSLRFVIRRSKSFTPTNQHKIRFNGKKYDITSALNDDYENDTVTITVKGLGM